jgi:cbb3-type cytochrome oxidase subunit 3
MIQKVLSSIGGVGNYGVIAVILFFVVFLGVLLWVFGLRRTYLDRMSQLPLEGDDADLVLDSNRPISTLKRHE